MRNVAVYTLEGAIVNVYWNTEYKEYVLYLYGTQSKLCIAEYYTDDKADAFRTALVMLNQLFA